MISVLGAGPHGRQIAALTRGDLYDDDFLIPVVIGAKAAPYIIGAAWPRTRHLIEAQVEGEPFERGVFKFPGSVVGNETSIGAHTHIGFNAVISHGCKVGAFVNICPGAVLSGEAVVHDDVFIGANATIIHGGVTIGRGAVIGAGAVVLCDVGAGEVWAGNPARRIR